MIREIICPKPGQRGYVYQVKWNDGSQSEDLEKHLLKLNEPDEKNRRMMMISKF